MRPPPPIADFPKFPVTGGTILLAIGVTVVYLTHSVDISPLLETGEIRRWELWRILTSALPHANILHLAFNLYWTWVFGTLLEQAFGHLRTFLVFVLLALIANGSEFALLSGGIGLSGIGYGLFGFMWVMSRRDGRFTDAVDPRTIQMFVVWFFICIAMTVMGSPIANVAHGTGCLAGALLGWTVSEPMPRRASGVTAMIVCVLAVLAGATIARPWVNLSKYVGGDWAKEAGSDEARFGYEALLRHQNEQARQWCQDAVRMNPKEAGYWYNLGVACERLSQRPQALEAYQHAADLAPEDKSYRSAVDGMRSN
jgi:membrane associated rhomboid family serine protease